ncbi:MAG: hypothetical protein Q9225_005362, partial [Loekoesia sp. 1 TL-2023]
PAAGILHTELKQFNYNETLSPYAGSPSAELDEAWHNLLQCQCPGDAFDVGWGRI